MKDLLALLAYLLGAAVALFGALWLHGISYGGSIVLSALLTVTALMAPKGLTPPWVDTKLGRILWHVVALAIATTELLGVIRSAPLLLRLGVAFMIIWSGAFLLGRGTRSRGMP
jgi:hypothetical protein